MQIIFYNLRLTTSSDNDNWWWCKKSIMGMSFIWFLILDFEDPWSKLILKAQIMYLREIYNDSQKKKKEIYKTFPRKKK